MLIDIEKVVIRNRIRKDFGDIQELATDIQENGLINPPVINKDYYLLAGERRIRACKSLGWKQIPVTMMDTRDAEHDLEIEISENEVRKDFSKAERIDYARRLERIEAAKAEKRKEATSFGGGGNISTSTGKTRDIVAAKMGIGSGKQYEKEKSIVDNKDLISVEDFQNWDEGKLSTNKVYQQIKAKLDASNRKIAELESRKTEVKEVVPEDYEDIKKRLKTAEYNAKRAESDFEEMKQSAFESKRRIKELESQIGATEKLRKANLTINHFTVATNDYIQRYGGHVWAFSEIEKVDEATKNDFIKAIKSLDGFAQQLIRNLDGGIADGK